MVNSVTEEVVRALREKGLSAVKAFRRQELLADEQALICVDVKNAKGLAAGFGGYLGLGVNPETGISEELYGARCELELALDIYAGMSGGAQECRRCAGKIPMALTRLPEGIKISSLSFGAAAPDAATGMFKCPGTLSCTAFFIAREQEEDGVFTDFVLRGRVEK